MKKLALVLVATLTACGGAAATSSAPTTPGRTIQAESAPSLSTAQYHTFAFRLAGAPPPPFQVSPRSFEVEKRVRPLIVAELVRKGYVEQTGDGKPDFLVRFASGNANETVPYTGEPGGEADANRSVDKGRIVIDAFDATTQAQVWHGSVEAEINPDKINDQRLGAGIQQLFASFPAKGTDAVPQGAASQQAH